MTPWPSERAGRASSPRLTRRDLLLGATAAATSAYADGALALGRVPVGGSLAFRLPWATGRLDPHDLFDPLAALFGHAIADPLYALDAAARPYPTLADGMPELRGGHAVVRLRPGLRSAKGKAIRGADLAWSVERARKRGAAGLLASLGPTVRAVRGDPLAVRFGRLEPTRLARLLSSPVTAVLPRGFSARSPDGTGAFAASLSNRKLELRRNERASRGPSFLDRTTVTSARTMTDSLRAFETGRDDLGWLGAGLYGRRSGARAFDYGWVGWVVLVTGKRAGELGRPGVAQQIANAVPVERLPHLGLGRAGGAPAGAQWTGDRAELWVDEGSSQLAVIAEAVAAELSRAGHEVQASPASASRLRRLRRSGDFALALDVVRRIGRGPAADMIALATADRPALGRSLGKHPPRLAAARAPHQLTATLRLGVLGSLAVRGATAPKITLAAARPRGLGLDLGSSYRA